MLDAKTLWIQNSAKTNLTASVSLPSVWQTSSVDDAWWRHAWRPQQPSVVRAEVHAHVLTSCARFTPLNYCRQSPSDSRESHYSTQTCDTTSSDSRTFWRNTHVVAGGCFSLIFLLRKVAALVERFLFYDLLFITVISSFMLTVGRRLLQSSSTSSDLHELSTICSQRGFE